MSYADEREIGCISILISKGCPSLVTWSRSNVMSFARSPLKTVNSLLALHNIAWVSKIADRGSANHLEGNTRNRDPRRNIVSCEAEKGLVRIVHNKICSNVAIGGGGSGGIDVICVPVGVVGATVGVAAAVRLCTGPSTVLRSAAACDPTDLGGSVNMSATDGALGLLQTTRALNHLPKTARMKNMSASRDSFDSFGA